MKKAVKKVIKKTRAAKKTNHAKVLTRHLTKKPLAAVGNGVSRSVGVTPLADRVLVRPLSPEEMGTTTSFGIIIPDSVGSKEKPEQGIVVAVGSGKFLDDGSIRPLEVSVGNRIMFSKYGYDEVKVGGVEYFIIGEQNVLAIIN